MTKTEKNRLRLIEAQYKVADLLTALAAARARVAELKRKLRGAK